MSGYRPDDHWSKGVVSDEDRLANKRSLQGLTSVLLIWIITVGIGAVVAGHISIAMVVGTAWLVAIQTRDRGCGRVTSAWAPSLIALA